MILLGSVAPLEGVAITVTLEGGEEIHTTTDNQGQYRSDINHKELSTCVHKVHYYSVI